MTMTPEQEAQNAYNADLLQAANIIQNLDRVSISDRNRSAASRQRTRAIASSIMQSPMQTRLRIAGPNDYFVGHPDGTVTHQFSGPNAGQGPPDFIRILTPDNRRLQLLNALQRSRATIRRTTQDRLEQTHEPVVKLALNARRKGEQPVASKARCKPKTRTRRRSTAKPQSRASRPGARSRTKQKSRR